MELEAEGHDLYFVGVNGVSADNDDDRQELVDRTAIPLWQDVEEVQVWARHHEAGKDDFLIYDAEGKLADYLPANGSRDTNLSTSEGYDNVKQAILDVLP